MKRNLDEKDIFNKFKKLGWSNDSQSKTIFNFLMKVHKQVKSNQILLDLGAGECRYSFFFDNCYYISVDFAKGDRKWDFSKLDILGDITKLNFLRDNSVDYILNTVVLEHINEPHKFLKEVARVLKPGGRLFIQAPFLFAEHQVPYDFFRYTSYGLRYLMKQSGLKIISLDPTNSPLYTGSRIASYSLQVAAGNNIPVKVILLFLRYFSKLLLPLFDKLEPYIEKHNLPLGWILVAKKEGNSIMKKHTSREQAVDSIICCPICKSAIHRLNGFLKCSKCTERFPIINEQLNFLEY